MKLRTAFPAAVLLAFFALLTTTALAQTDVVTTSGTVRGFVVGSGPTAVTKWLGVPYGEPATGSRRWARPVARSTSPTLIDATLPRSACTQVLTQFALECRDVPSQTAGTLVGSEDCLSLSIWRPTAAAPTPRPVMVWIHGGGFGSGCAKDGLSEGSDLALHGADGGQIVVAIQYRLGPMGFFALEELASEDASGSAGNYGVRDMVLALEWVQANIAAFGGDPANVTIFGESAGGTAACALLASPLTDDLFERAVTESGNCSQAIPLRAGANSGLPATSTAIGRGETLSAHASLACTNPGTRLACMRSATPAAVFNAFHTQPSGTATNIAIDGSFITEQPLVMLYQGAAGTRPLIIGANANEMTTFTLSLSLPDAAAYETLVRLQLGNFLADQLLPIWPASEFPTPLAAYRRIIEDLSFVCPTFTAAKGVNDSGGNAYVYHLAYSPNAAFGSFHGLDVYYLFGTYARLAGLGITPDAGDEVLSSAIQQAWTSYARTGTPLATPVWPPFAPAPSSPAANGSALVWNLTAGNALSNSVALAGALRDGRCAELEVIGPLLNADADSRTNDVDNCDYTANSDQADTGGVAGAGADGIGDACQCGDVGNDGLVTAPDTTSLRTLLASGLATDASLARKCSVAGGSPACDILDFAVLARRVGGLAPALAPACAAANPT